MAMRPKTMRKSTGMDSKNTVATVRFNESARMAAPKTMKGLRKKSLRNMLRPFCTWFTSLVMRVMRVEPPMVSTSEKPRDWMWAKSAPAEAGRAADRGAGGEILCHHAAAKSHQRQHNEQAAPAEM